LAGGAEPKKKEPSPRSAACEEKKVVKGGGEYAGARWNYVIQDGVFEKGGRRSALVAV